MIQPAAPMSLSLRLVTGFVRALTAALLLAGAYSHSWPTAASGLFLAVISLVCYLLAPVRYELTDRRLIVFFRLGRLSYQPVIRCSRLDNQSYVFRMLRTVRLFGNGG